MKLAILLLSLMTVLHSSAGQAETPKSLLIVSKYSGRPDPSYPLVNYLTSQYTRELKQIGRQALKAPPAFEAQILQMSHLGYRGIVIDDREGLVFAKGSRIQIFETQALAYLNNSNKPVWLELDHPFALEREFAAKEAQRRSGFAPTIGD